MLNSFNSGTKNKFWQPGSVENGNETTKNEKNEINEIMCSWHHYYDYCEVNFALTPCGAYLFLHWLAVQM